MTDELAYHRKVLGDVGLLDGARALWKEQLLFDYIIEVQDDKYHVHKVVMASVSDYFKVMLTGGMKESQRDRVRLEEQSSVVVSTMIKYMYTGTFDNDEARLEDLLACAVYLQIPAAIKECTKLINEKVDKDNCLDILYMYQMYHLEDGISHTIQYIESNFDDVVKEYVPHNLDYHALVNLIDLWQHSEWDLFQCIHEWICLDAENRSQHIEKLMSLVHFALIPPQELKAIKKKDVYSNATVCKLVNEALKYHNLAIHLKVLDDSEQSTVRAKPSPMCYIVERSNSQKMYSYCDGESWKQHKGHRKPTFTSEVDASIVVNNFLVLCDSVDQAWHIFDPRTFKWSTIASTRTPKSKFAMVQHDMQLYIFGGLIGWCVDQEGNAEHRPTSDEIECYDFKTNCWSILPSKLPVPLFEHSAGVIDGNIYVGCGRETSGGGISTRLDCFNPVTGMWNGKAPMMKLDGKHRKLLVVELPGETVLFVMDLFLKIQCYRPSVNQWEWMERGGERCIRWSLRECEDVSVLSHKNDLYLLDATFGKHRTAYNLGLCANWTLDKKGRVIWSSSMQRFPKYKQDKENRRRATGNHFDQMKTAYAVMLSVPQYM